MTGTLYIVATPIGNLEDITLRAVRVLREADLVVAEDTRATGVLLAHLGIKKPLLSAHEHNEKARAQEVIGWLAAGKAVAYVSEAGTPGISDPGERLVSDVAAAGHPVVPVPGPSAVTAALSASGLPADDFLFLGFLPSNEEARRGRIREASEETRTLVLYEAPHRIVPTVEILEEELGPRRAVLFRELTKVHEEAMRGTLAELREGVARKEPRGEYVVVVEGAAVAGRAKLAATDEPVVRAQVEALCGQGLSRRDAVDRVARERGVARREVYRLALPPRRP